MFSGDAKRVRSTMYGTVYGEDVVDSYSGAGTGTSSFMGTAANTNNTAAGDYSVVVGGDQNTVNTAHSFVGGGEGNTCATGTHGVVGGGENNLADATYASVAGGFENQSKRTYSFIGGGRANINYADYGVVAGGRDNVPVLGDYIAIGGGRHNETRNDFCTIAGGGGETFAEGNKVHADYGTVGGGNNNDVLAAYATIPGGKNNVASASFATAIGFEAVSDHYGGFTQSSGQFSSSSDAQSTVYILRQETTGTGTTLMYLDGSSAQITIASSHAAIVSVEYIAKKTGSTDKAEMGWGRFGVIASIAGTSGVSYTQTNINGGGIAPTLAFSFTSGDPGVLSFTVASSGGYYVRHVARVTVTGSRLA